MPHLLETDWSRLFTPEISIPEILIRGTLVYLALCILLQVILKRQAGKISLSDLLVVAIVAGICRNPLVRDAYSIPSTVGDDGDPLDVLILMDEPLPPGCKVAARSIGVIEAEQTEDGRTERNDRLLAVAEHCHEFQGIRSITDIDKHLAKEIEHFFVSYNEMAGKRFKPIGCRGPRRAVGPGRRQATTKAGPDGAPTNGRQKAGKG